MKKTIFFVLSVAVLAAIASFVFIPSDIKVSSVALSSVNHMAAHRVLMDDEVWKKWWPGEEKLSYNGTSFSITKKLLNSFELSLTHNGETTYGVLQIIPIKIDTARLVWSYTLHTDKNPINRFAKYKQATTLKKNLDFLLDSLSSYLGKKETIYGFTVIETTVTDSVLISTRRSFKYKPDNRDIDEMIQSLRKYIAANNAEEKNFPMLNILKADSANYEAMVAIAVDKMLPETKEFAPKLVLKGGYILEAQIQGGQFTIEKGMEEFENFRSDYKYTSPAIPYQLLVTDRMKEPDTTKWITKMYYPVF